MKTNTFKGIGLALLLALGLSVPVQAVEQHAQARKTSAETKTAAPPAAAQQVASEERQQVLAVGDSLMGGVAQMLAWRIKKDGRPLQLTDRHKLSTGLVNTRFYDWPVQLAGLVKTAQPDVVLIMLGANDASMGIRDNGKTYAYGSAGWTEVYRQRAQTMIELARSGGARVIWIGLPQMAKADYNAQIQMQNRIYAQVAREAGIPFVDSASLLVNDKGEYAASISEQGKAVSLRAKDGVHLAPRGGDILARAALAKLGTGGQVAALQ
ncbi:SGNH/GDSL hydrolase family protein [Chitinilyticum piscinae]|uniref:DUF459 domain-containing protein n=1 Tax=Chitinilyticum piscinae TaxID=2866724 RepID=A0A8J7K7P9_9NEIS|nr:DUF459 domain-containing protein [Chitinilyticum piscinae]MBE9608413.1 DUF459 domain-containing protein [Chitinilyticum piscinae]